MARKPLKQRNAEQRVRQHKLRKEARDKRRPGRDDIARMLLWQMIVGTRKRRSDWRAVLDELRDQIVAGLERQGFDPDQAETVFEELVDKYAKGDFPFRIKRHLDRSDDAS